MSIYSIGISEFLEKRDGIPVMDVRSPAEFEQGHVPGSMNLPLLSNEERSVVGTLYLQKGSSEAMMKGLEYIGPKMRAFAERASTMAPGGEVLLYCWRGGMRSNSMAWLFNMIGIKAQTLEGGYKAFRRNAHDTFARPLNFIVIGGLTGSGKTEVLEMIASMGHQVVHLEQLACHKGSVFGGAGMPSQPTTEQFENELFDAVRRLDPQEVIYIEDESLTIGSVFIPRPFFDQMSSSPMFQLMTPLEMRVGRLVKNYACLDPEWLVDGVRRIARRMGLERAGQVIDSIRSGAMAQAVEKVLPYYDKVYARSMNRNPGRKIAEISADPPEIIRFADEILIRSHTFAESVIEHSYHNNPNNIKSPRS